MSASGSAPQSTDDPGHATTGLLGEVWPVGRIAVSGWALDPARPGEQLALEIRGDGVHLGLVRAESFSPDLRERFSTHRERATLRSPLVDDTLDGCSTQATSSPAGPETADEGVAQ